MESSQASVAVLSRSTSLVGAPSESCTPTVWRIRAVDAATDAKSTAREQACSADSDSYYAETVEVHRSARKHGVVDVDSVRAATEPVAVIVVEDTEPPKEIRVGFDTAGRLLETVVLLLDDDREMVIHAMRARRKYVDELL